MNKGETTVTKLFAVIGAIYLVWFLIAALTGIRGPFGMNQ